MFLVTELFAVYLLLSNRQYYCVSTPTGYGAWLEHVDDAV